MIVRFIPADSMRLPLMILVRLGEQDDFADKVDQGPNFLSGKSGFYF